MGITLFNFTGYSFNEEHRLFQFAFPVPKKPVFGIENEQLESSDTELNSINFILHEFQVAVSLLSKEFLETLNLKVDIDFEISSPQILIKKNKQNFE